MIIFSHGIRFKISTVLLLCLLSVSVVQAKSYTGQHTFPKILNMNIGNTFYEQQEYQKDLSKADVVILGFYPRWQEMRKMSVREAVRALKRINPALLVGQYTVLSETFDVSDTAHLDQDKARKLDAENWWLRDKNGDRKQWTSQYNAWDINITEWTKPDKNGLRYPQWQARRDYDMYFRNVPEFDIWYMDNSLSKPAVKSADWSLKGHDETADDPKIARAYRRGHVSYWRQAKKLAPKLLLVGNSDDVSSPEYTRQLQGVFMEAAIGKWWSTETLRGWDKLMARYRSAMQNTSSPHLVALNVWGKANDYQRMRYGLGSCLLDDGYFSYTDEDKNYGSVVWFDEFDVDLGKAIEPPATRPWENGIYRRRFERGMVLVNPDTNVKYIDIPSGYWRIKGTQAPEINNGKAARSITLQGKDGIVLLKARQ